jgi:hypothetical protein
LHVYRPAFQNIESNKEQDEIQGEEEEEEENMKERKIRYFNIVPSRPTAGAFHICRKPTGD